MLKSVFRYGSYDFAVPTIPGRNLRILTSPCHIGATGWKLTRQALSQDGTLCADLAGLAMSQFRKCASRPVNTPRVRNVAATLIRGIDLIICRRRRRCIFRIVDRVRASVVFGQ